MEGRKCFIYRCTQLILFTVIWRWRYGKGPLIAARDLLYAPSHRQDITYHSLCFTSRGALAGTRNSSVGLLWRSKILKEGNVLFNNTFNTFYLGLYGVRDMVKDHSDSERGNTVSPLHGLLFPTSSKVSIICTITHRGYDIPHSLFHQSWKISIGPLWRINDNEWMNV